jgi:hypothetical protein
MPLMRRVKHRTWQCPSRVSDRPILSAASRNEAIREFAPGTGNRPRTYWEPTGHVSLRYRHSKRTPCRSRYLSHPKARRHRATRFLSVCVHKACGLFTHLSSTSPIETLERDSAHGPITSSQGSPSYRSICWSEPSELTSPFPATTPLPHQTPPWPTPKAGRDRGLMPRYQCGRR